jgi:hypothetical protein
MKNLVLLLSFLTVVTFSACSTTAEIGSEKTVEKSGSTPDWVLKPTIEEGQYIYVTGELTKGIDRSFGMSQAYADGMRKLMNMMQNAIKSQSTSALRGSNVSEEDLGRISEFAVSWISTTDRIAGVHNPESYWEKVEVKTETGVKYYYNCYSKLRISTTDYKKALAGAFNEMKRKAVEENNKKAEETATRLLESVKANN